VDLYVRYYAPWLLKHMPLQCFLIGFYSLFALKYTGDKATSESLEKIAALVEEYLPQIKAVSSGATVNRLVCGACLDFKLMTTVRNAMLKHL
jgi:hypothetical protein